MQTCMDSLELAPVRERRIFAFTVGRRGDGQVLVSDFTDAVEGPVDFNAEARPRNA
jgi:hypothetical protein